MNNCQRFTIDKKKGLITMDINFFRRVFLNSNLSPLSLKLACLLIVDTLEVHTTQQFRFLPPRKALAVELGATAQSVNNSLYELERVGFLIRQIDGLENMVHVNEQDNILAQQYYRDKKEEGLKRKDFSGKFAINYFYNMTTTDIQNETLRNLDPTIQDILSRSMNN